MKVSGWQMEAAYRASCPVPFKGIPDILRSHIDLMATPLDRQFAERCDADPEFIQAALGVIRSSWSHPHGGFPAGSSARSWRLISERLCDEPLEGAERRDSSASAGPAGHLENDMRSKRNVRRTLTTAKHAL